MGARRDANGRFIKGSGGGGSSNGKVRDIDKGFNALMKRLVSAADPTSLTVGIHEAEGSEQKKEEHGTSELTLVEIAAIHEFGLAEPDIPRRSFITDWADENAERHKGQLRTMAKAVIKGAVESESQALERLGNLYVGEVQKRIAEGIEPPLAESTIKRKGSSKPLIDTGQLRSAVTYLVKKGT